MATSPLQDILKELILEQPSHVGALAAAIDKDLCGTFSQLRFDLAEEDEVIAPERLVAELKAFGKAVGAVGVYYAILVDHYNQICLKVKEAGLSEIPSDPMITEEEHYAARHLLLTRSLRASIPIE